MNEWIPVDTDLYRKPKFVAFCRAMQCDKFSAAGRVLAVWFWVQSYGPTTALDASGVDEATGTPPGTTDALIASGWATANRRSGTIRFHWPGETLAERRERRSEAGRKAVNARWERARSGRAFGYDGDTTVVRPYYKSESESKSNTQNHSCPDGQEAAPVSIEAIEPDASRPRSRSRMSPIAWDEDAGFSGVTEADRRAWAEAAPTADIDREIAKAHAWLRSARPVERWRNFRAGLGRWFARCQRHAERSAGPQLTRSNPGGTLPLGCYLDADGVARTASGAPLDR